MKAKIINVMAGLIFNYALVSALQVCMFVFYEPEIPQRITEITN